eukprot:scaffold55810_cov60-Phaeocystis_antarctica.AAC.4
MGATRRRCPFGRQPANVLASLDPNLIVPKRVCEDIRGGIIHTGEGGIPCVQGSRVGLARGVTLLA